MSDTPDNIIMGNVFIYRGSFSEIILDPAIILAIHVQISNQIETSVQNTLTTYEFDNLKTANSNKYNCPICLENKNTGKILPCKHIFCDKCIKSWLTEKSNTCPLCRKNVE
jgi:hypothetical protein